MKRNTFVSLVYALCFAALGHLACSAERPNIVIILADDLGYGDVRCFNPDGKIPTPQLDRLAAQGLRFTDAHSSSAVCSPTRYSLLTGRYNWRSRLQSGVLGGLSPRLIEPGRLTIAEMLRRQGYATGAIGKWHLGMDWSLLPGKTVSKLGIETSGQVRNVDYSKAIKNGPNSLGFDCYFGISASLDMVPYTFIENDRVTALPTAEKSFPMTAGQPGKRTRTGPAAPDFEAEAVLPTLTRRAVAFIESRAKAAREGQPFFLYVALNAPHTPILPAKEWQGKSGISAYADFVMQTDDSIGQILTALERQELSSNTLVLMASDNGCSPEANFQQLAAAGHHPSYVFRGAKADIFDGGHRIPLIARWPGHVPVSQTNNALVCLVDVMATLAHLVGVTLPPNAGEDSVSFLPALLGQPGARSRENVVHHSINGSFAIRDQQWKLELCPDSGGWSAPRPGSPAAAKLPPVQLYDLSTDIAETNNAQARHPEIVARLTSLLERQIADGRSTPGSPQTNTVNVQLRKDAPRNTPRAEAPTANRPNFLFIYTDDQRFDALSVVQREQGAAGRFPWFCTPSMDRLAAEGVRFRNAFIVNSLCAPSRAVNLTGRYNHFNGIASNFRAFPVTNVTHATLLRAAGYTTAYIGKWHMDNQRERPGFDFYASFVGHARYVDPVFIVQGKDTPTKGWVDDISTDYAIDFLKRQKDSPKPWSLVVGFKSPHGPFEPPPRARTRYAGEQARAVPNLNTPAPYMGTVLRQRQAGNTNSVPVNLDYFRCISAADDCVGRLLSALDELDLATNTMVIYTSDNGFYLGEHGLGDKRSAYDESLRVPFLVRYPALREIGRGRIVDEMVLNLDLAPSLLDFAGVPIPKEMQGRSWRPLLTGASPNWRKAWFYEYFAEKQVNSRVPDITAVRTADAKLIKYPGHDGWTELFDLKQDPFETRNLFTNPAFAALRASLEAEHDRLKSEVGYRVPAYVDRPDWWGKMGGPDWTPEVKQALRLDFNFAEGQGQGARDKSGLGNNGELHGVQFGQAEDGSKALRCTGEGYVEVPKSASLNPARQPWTVEVVAKPEKPDGMLLARGGRTHGYALWLKDGRPAFTVTMQNQAFTAQSVEAVSGWTTFTGVITAAKQAQLRINGKLVATANLQSLMQKDPNDSMQIGADTGSPVVDPAPPKFTGWIKSVRISSAQEGRVDSGD